MTSTGFEGSGEAQANGVSLAYSEQGEGEPVVFVHGALSDLRTWEQQLPAVGRSYRAISYSRRFARPNPPIEAGADDPMAPHVEDLAAFLRGIGAAPAHLVGNSAGAFIALLTAIRHPGLVRTLVLEEPPVVTLFVKHVPPRAGELVHLFATRPRTALSVLKGFATAFVPAQRAFRRGEDAEAMRLFCHGVLGREPFERLPEARVEQMRDNLDTLRAQLLGEGLSPLGDDEVRAVRVPVLLVTGEQSPSFLLRLTDRLEELLPDAEHVEIRGASHVMHEEDAPAVNQAILRFLGRAGAAGPAPRPC